MSEAEGSLSRPSLVCVEYPGRVESIPAMLDTLGGTQTLQQVLDEPNRRLELRFRPSDVFCKPTCGERSRETAFLIRVKKKKRTRNGKVEYKYDAEIVGAVESSFRFNNLADFQYLPMVRKMKKGEEGKAEAEEQAKYESIYSDIYFKSLVDSSWLGLPAPLFLPPAAFSRMDCPQDYQYRREAASDKATLGTPYNIIGRTRQRRSHHAIFVTFDVDKVPDAPRDVAVNQLKVKFIGHDDTKEVRDLFQTRPLWSKNALHALTHISPERLKFILPTLAYYFTTGPWRNQWVRFGYDPRKERESSKFQTLDYRVRLQGGARHKVKAKRSYANYLLPYKAMNWSKSKTSVIDRDAFSDLAGASGAPAGAAEDDGAAAAARAVDDEEQENKNDVYRFRSGRVPPYRQMFYQFTDLEVPEAQDLIKSSIKKHSSKCDEKSGWFEEGTDSKLRMILSQHLNVHLKSKEGKEGLEEEEEDEDEADYIVEENEESSEGEEDELFQVPEVLHAD